MATEVKNDGLSKDEYSLLGKALTGLKSSILRAKTKEIKDEDMVAIYDKRMIEIDRLLAKVMTKELFK